MPPSDDLPHTLHTPSFLPSTELYTIIGGRTDVVYAVPNDCRGDLLNAEDMPGRIAIVDRGTVSQTYGGGD